MPRRVQSRRLGRRRHPSAAATAAVAGPRLHAERRSRSTLPGGALAPGGVAAPGAADAGRGGGSSSSSGGGGCAELGRLRAPGTAVAALGLVRAAAATEGGEEKGTAGDESGGAAAAGWLPSAPGPAAVRAARDTLGAPVTRAEIRGDVG